MYQHIIQHNTCVWHLVISATPHVFIHNGDYVKEIAEAMECFVNISFVDNDRQDAIGRLDELPSFYPEYNCAIAACNDGEERLMGIRN